MPYAPIYLDYCATTPCDERVVEAMLPYFNTSFGNASSKSHYYGWQANAAVDKARKQVAQLIHSTPEEIIFTSGATEACNLALRGVFELYQTKGRHIITTQTEHKAVLDTCKRLEKKGAEITYLPVTGNGGIDLSLLEAAIRPDTVLIAVMYANNETGVVMPVREIGRLAKKHKVLFFCDATQAVGKIPVDVQADHIDLLCCSAHKMYGPKGVGALYVRKRDPRVKLAAQITGGGQEGDIRSGTLNVPGIVGLGAASAICYDEMQAEATRLKALRDRLQQQLLHIEDSRLNGDPTRRLPQVLNCSFKYIPSSQMLAALNNTVAVSSGSACTSGSLDPSFVLKAMGIADEWARAAIRFSLGRFTTESDVAYVLDEVKRHVAELRAQSPAWQLRNSDKRR